MAFNTNDLFDAISTVADSVAKKYKSDQTVEAKIVSNSQRKDGIYKVEYQSAIFDAYSNEAYYLNERVYVTVPQGDFTKQKYIIGRIVETEDGENKTNVYNFKLPFDNFIALDDLTYNNKPEKRGFVANRPMHGATTYNEVSVPASTVSDLVTTQQQWLNVEQNLRFNFEAWCTFLGEYSSGAPGNALSALLCIDGTQTYLQWIKDLMSQTLAAENKLTRMDVPQIYNVVLNDFQTKYHDTFSIERGDYNALYAYARTMYSQALSMVQTQIELTQQDLNSTKESYISDNKYLNSSDLLWYWVPAEPRDLTETKLGIGIDVQTFLGSYKPRSGDYGLRIIIDGVTRSTETEPARTVTDELMFKVADMYGNVYGFYEPYTQQKIFDISRYMSISRIAVFFWQDHNFVDYTGKYIPHEDANGRQMLSNIIIDDLTIKLGLTADECKTDRVFLYTYDDLYFGQDPLSGTVKTDRTLQFQWVHITNKGPMVIKLGSDAEDISQFAYWKQKSDATVRWYHYEYGCAQNVDNIYERQGGINWKMLTEHNEIDAYSITVTPDITKAREKYKAIVSVDGVPFETEPLILLNVDASIDTTGPESINSIVFKVLRQDDTEHIVDDDTLRAFNVYDQENRVIQNDNHIYYSDLKYFIQVWIRNNDTGEYSPMSYDPDDGFESIEFNFPQSNTMIGETGHVKADELSRAYYAPIRHGASDEYNDRIMDITRYFKIKPQWIASYTNNTITATVVRRGKTYHPSITFTFGSASSDGSDYSIALIQNYPMVSGMIKDHKFSVSAVVRDRAGNVEPHSKFLFSWSILSPTMITESEESSTFGYIIEDKYDFLGNTITGFIRNDYPLILKVTVRNVDDYPISQVAGFKLFQNVTIAEKYTLAGVPEKVEFKSDGSVPITYFGTFLIQKNVGGVRYEDTYPTWHYYQGTKSGQSFSPFTEPKYFKLKETYIAERNLVTNSNPTVYYKPSSFDENIPDLTGSYSLESRTDWKAGDYNSLVNAINAYYNDWLDEVIDPLSDIAVDIENARESELNALNKTVKQNIPSHVEYALDPYIKANDASWYWDDELENLYTYLSCDLAEGYCRQAVAFAHNLYSSSLLNSWDGKLFHDEASNSVLAQMLGAGTKDRDNRFTGVIMGNWEAYGDESIELPGLYGFTTGQQTFGFRTDGTGFIGKSGKGQIQFDGNSSLISNADRTSYINLDPVTYSLTESGFDVSSSHGYSQYFLYSEATKTSSMPIVGVDKVESAMVWAKKFIEDTSKDYFVVDPNNGVLTSGGIIAKYGKIGNWIISDSGLYQKYTDSSLTNSRYMYLGYPGVDEATLNAAKAPYENKLAQIRSQRESAIDQLDEKYRLKELEYLREYLPNSFEYDPLHYFNCGWPYKAIEYAIRETLYQINSSTPANNIRPILEEHLATFIGEEDRTGYHYRYNNGQPYSIEYSGDKSDYEWIVANMTVTEPDGDTTVWVNDNKSHYNENQKRTVSFAHQGTNYNALPRTTEAYYVDPTWVATWRSYGADAQTCNGINTNNETYDHLEKVLRFCQAIYRYFADKYIRQLEAMKTAAVSTLAGDSPVTSSEKAKYLKFKQTLDRSYNEELTAVKHKYQLLLDAQNRLLTKAIAAVYDNDKDKYAIFAGYSPTSTPLFSVNWRGYMTARAGKIGDASPWYITDQGLTQKNNSGIIFLGNPDAPSTLSEWTDLGSDVGNIDLLPNNADGPIVLGASDPDNTPTHGKFAIYAGGVGKAWVWETTANNGAGGYVRSDEATGSIKFGVRMDGTLYSTQGLIGGWYITKNMLYSGNPTNPNDVLILDAERGIINLGNAIILSKDGSVTLGKLDDQGVSAGTICIAGVFFKGRSTDHVDWNIPTYTLTSDGGVQVTNFGSDAYNFWGSSKVFSEQTITAGSNSVTTAAHDMSFTSLLDIINTDSVGVTIAIGYETANNTKKAVAIYPTTSKFENSVLGTKDHPWDVVADYMTCNTLDVTKGNISALNLFMGTDQQLVATQFWVRSQLQDVYAKIKDAASGGSDAGRTARSAASGLSGALNKIGSLLDLLSKYTFFISGIAQADIQSTTKLKLKTLDFTAAWQAIDATTATMTSVPSGGTDPAATPGEGEEVLINLDAYHLLWTAGGSTLRDVIAAMVPIGGEAEGKLLSFDASTGTLKGSIKAKGGSSVPGLEATVGSGSSSSISLAHSHSVEFSAPTGATGTITLTVGAANFSDATDKTATLDVASTSWYTSQAIEVSHANDASSNRTTFRLYYGNTDMGKSILAVMSEDVANKQVLLKVSDSQVAKVSTQKTYDAGAASVTVDSVSISGSSELISSASGTAFSQRKFTTNGTKYIKISISASAKKSDGTVMKTGSKDYYVPIVIDVATSSGGDSGSESGT